MISRIFVLTLGGVVCYAKKFFVEPSAEVEENFVEEDLIGGFLTAISSFAKEIQGGDIRSLNFMNCNFVYSYDIEFGAMFVIVTDIDDPEEEARPQVELIKKEFINRFRSQLEDFRGCVSEFYDFDEFVEEYIFIPPKILLTGEIGVGKTTIMDLFPGETILELDDDLIEVIQKTVNVSDLGDLKQFLLREFDLEELVDKSKTYRPLLNTVDAICIITNSAASNLGRTKRLVSRLKPKVKKADFYIIANFQDIEDAAFEPEKIEKSFGIKTYGFSAIHKDAKKEIDSIFNEILINSILDKIQEQQSRD